LPLLIIDETKPYKIEKGQVVEHRSKSEMTAAPSLMLKSV